MHKRFLNLLAIVSLMAYPGFAVAAQTEAHQPQVVPITTPIETQEYAIAFDLDGVVFRPSDKWDKFKAMWHIPVRTYKAAWKQYRTYDSGSMYTWYLFCLQHGALKGARYFEKMMRSKKLYGDTKNLIQRLHKKKYKLFIASNQGYGEIELHRNEPSTKAVFDCFTDYVVIDDAPGKVALKKPDAAYYQELKRMMQSHVGTSVKLIFIDDIPENVEAARKEGFIAILCTHPAKLLQQLRAVGVKI